MNWQNKNILITGISRFVGPYLAEELIKRRTNVFGLIRKRADGTKPKNLLNKGIVNGVHLLEGDLIDIASLVNAFDDFQPDELGKGKGKNRKIFFVRKKRKRVRELVKMIEEVI